MNRNVLVVYSNREFGGYIQSSLEQSGLYQVAVASTRDEAMKKIRSQDFDIALIDLDLPGSSAYAICETLATSKTQVPIVAAISTEQLTDDVLQNPRYRFVLSKPISLSDLPGVLADAISSKEHSAPIEQTIPSVDARAEDGEAIPPWLEEKNIAAGYLDVLKGETEALMIQLLRGSALFATSGEMNEGVRNAVIPHINLALSQQDCQGIYVKFVEVPNAANGVTIVMKCVLGDYRLLAIFNGFTDFRAARQQTQHITDSLAHTNPASYLEARSS